VEGTPPETILCALSLLPLLLLLLLLLGRSLL
jgi:hypothetical protein